MSDHVELRGSAPPLVVHRGDVYFTFASGRLNYDCHACRATCCRGHGYALGSQDELQVALHTRPTLAWFVELPVRDVPSQGLVKNCPPTCFFLDSSARCSVQSEHGYGAKPETCRLFPFNMFRVVGQRLIVSPHLGLCPLAVVPKGEAAAASDHVALFGAMADKGISAQIKSASAPPGSIDARLDIEKAIRDRLDSEPVLYRYEDAVKLQSSIESSAEELSATDTHIEDFQAALRAALGTWPSVQADRDPHVVHVMVSMTPLLRSLLLFPTDDPTGRVAVLAKERAAFMILALQKIVALALQTGMQDVTYQTVLRLFQTYFSLIVLLGFADRRLIVAPGKRLDLSATWGRRMNDRYLDAVRMLMAPTANLATFGRVLATVGEKDTVGRLATLNNICARLLGNVVPAEAHIKNTAGRLTVWIQRTLVTSLDNERLFNMADRRRIRQDAKNPGT